MAPSRHDRRATSPGPARSPIAARAPRRTRKSAARGGGPRPTVSTPARRAGPDAQARRFDAKLGADFLASVPAAPGVYRWLAADGAVVYVGKAKNLRRRLAQYRNAGRSRHHAKARRVLRDAARVAFDVLSSDLAACLEEVRLIQVLRPAHNVASAYEFLYPCLGVARRADHARLCFTTLPDHFGAYALHGAFRSREVTGAAFFALMRLLRYLAHPVPRRALGADDSHAYSYVFGWRRLAPRWLDGLERLWRGDDPALLGDLAVALVEHAGARAKADEVQADLRLLRAFFREEAAPLRAAITATGFPAWPVPQAERDPLFLRYRAAP